MKLTDFTLNYELYLNEIAMVIKPELLPIIDHLRTLDPQVLVSPETTFNSENQARGFV